LNDFMIAPMTRADIDAVYAIECDSFSVPWSRDDFIDLLENPGAAFFCAVDVGGSISGYAGLFYLPGGSADIMNLAVRSDRQRRGIASALLDRLERFAVSRDVELLMLEVRPSNRAARLLYRQLGYTEAGLRRNYYRRPAEDAILMNKIINIK
jgi:ribosomal-protein-alanine N-acetyltransferase